MRNDWLNPNDIDYWARKERIKDLWREAEKERLFAQLTTRSKRWWAWLVDFTSDR